MGEGKMLWCSASILLVLITVTTAPPGACRLPSNSPSNFWCPITIIISPACENIILNTWFTLVPFRIPFWRICPDFLLSNSFCKMSWLYERTLGEVDDGRLLEDVAGLKKNSEVLVGENRLPWNWYLRSCRIYQKGILNRGHIRRNFSVAVNHLPLNFHSWSFGKAYKEVSLFLIRPP